MALKSTQSQPIRKAASVNPDPDPLSALQVFDRLEIGPVKHEPGRLMAPYRLVWDGREDQTELIYSYEETVFDPTEPESRNLADMIAAQVALNYGLFCRAIVFHGTFDELDRRFIQDMAENTAREIYVKKFIEPNAFLTGEISPLPAVKRQKYLRASLEFPEIHQRVASVVFRPASALYPVQRRQGQSLELRRDE